MYPNTQDGNTATNPAEPVISPVSGAVSQEDSDMINKVKEYIDRGINALINQSKLHYEVEVLRSSIATMQEQIDKVRRQNDWLDEQLVRIRGERDVAIRDANTAQAARQTDQDTIAALQRQLNLAKTELGRDADEMASLKKERDDAQYTALQMEDELSKLRGKLEKFLSLADEIDPPQEPHLMPLPINTTQEAGSSTVQVPITQSWDTPKPAEPLTWEQSQGEKVKSWDR